MTSPASTVVDAERERPNIQEMYVVHRVFRRELRLLPPLVRAVREGDVARSALVGGHLRLVLDGLHMHHTGEDDVLWPLLLERAAPSADLVRTMQAQHERVDEHLDRLGPLLLEWTRTASALRGEQVARVTEDLRESLVVHLDLEEREILPLCSQHVTPAEWDSLGEHGRETISPRLLPILFGSMLEEADAAERAMMMQPLPLPVRLLMRAWGLGHYRRYIRRVRGQ